MKLIAQVKLQPSPEQADALRRTMLVYNDAANFVSEQAWMRKSFRAYDLHHATYYDVRSRFGLAAQLAIRVIAVVADAYKLDRMTRRTFRKMGSVTTCETHRTWDCPRRPQGHPCAGTASSQAARRSAFVVVPSVADFYRLQGEAGRRSGCSH